MPRFHQTATTTAAAAAAARGFGFPRTHHVHPPQFTRCCVLALVVSVQQQSVFFLVFSLGTVGQACRVVVDVRITAER